MNKILAVALAVTFGLTACSGYSDSPERKAFDAFVADCRANPAKVACVEWENSKKAN